MKKAYKKTKRPIFPVECTSHFSHLSIG